MTLTCPFTRPAEPAATGKCPVTDAFQPFDPEYLADSYKVFNGLRDETRVAYAPNYDTYLITHFDDIVAILKDRETFAASNATTPFRPIAPEAQAILSGGFPRKPVFSSADGPRHTMARSVATKVLTRRRWASVQPTVRAFVEAKIDALLKKDRSNLAEDLIFPTTALGGFTLIGFPLEDSAKLLGWCGKRVMLTYGDLSVEDQVTAAQHLVDFWQYVRDFVRMRVDNPADDITTDMLAEANASNGAVTIEDVDNMVYSIALASHETTANAMMNGLSRLLADRDAWNQLKADPSLIEGAVEELLRIDSANVTHRRLVTRDTEIGGYKLPKGASVIMLLGAGNHDPEHFPEPEKLDITRKNAIEHLSFGKHWHFCMGAPLARFEYNLVLSRLLERAPEMALIESEHPTYAPIILIRARDALWVHPNGAPSAQAAA